MIYSIFIEGKLHAACSSHFRLSFCNELYRCSFLEDLVRSDLSRTLLKEGIRTVVSSQVESQLDSQTYSTPSRSVNSHGSTRVVHEPQQGGVERRQSALMAHGENPCRGRPAKSPRRC